MDDEADWNNASDDTPWTHPGGDYASDVIDEITIEKKDGYGFRSFDVLEPVKDFVANPDKNFGFLVRNSFLAQQVAVPSSEYEVAEWRPKLTIEYTTSGVDLIQKRVRLNGMERPVKLSTINRTLHVTNNNTTTVRITLTRLDGTTVTSEMVPGGVRTILSVSNPGVYLISISGNNFTMHENVSFYH